MSGEAPSVEQQLPGGGGTAMGGSVLTLHSNAYNFASDGASATEGSGCSAATDASRSVDASASKRNFGRHQLGGRAIALRSNDGRVVRKMFCFHPDSRRGIGDSASTIDG